MAAFLAFMPFFLWFSDIIYSIALFFMHIWLKLYGLLALFTSGSMSFEAFTVYALASLPGAQAIHQSSTRKPALIRRLKWDRSFFFFLALCV